MARNRKQLRQMTVDQLEVPQITGTSSDTSGSASTLADGSLGRFGDNDLVGAWLYISSGTPTYRDARITDSAQTSDSGKGIITFRPAQNSSSMTANETYEILPYESGAIHTAIDEAMDELYDSGTLVRNIWLNHWLTGSPIYNSTFEYWDGTTSVDGWNVTTTLVSRLSYSSDHIVPSQNAVRLAGAGTLTLDNKYAQFLQDLSGDTVTLRAWVRTDTASNSRAQLLVDGSVVASTSYHSGTDDKWEMVSADGYGIADTATKITVQLHNASAQGDFGAVWLEGGTRVREYPFPIGLAPNGPDSIYSYHVSMDKGNNVSTVNARKLDGVRFGFNKYRYSTDELGVVELQSRPRSIQVLRMPASVPLTLPSEDADSVEVNRVDSLLICKMAAAKLLIKDMMHGPASFRQRASERSSILMQEVRQLAEGRGSTASNTAPLSPTW